jgi:hypothetical protein
MIFTSYCWKQPTNVSDFYEKRLFLYYKDIPERKQYEMEELCIKYVEETVLPKIPKYFWNDGFEWVDRKKRLYEIHQEVKLIPNRKSGATEIQMHTPRSILKLEGVYDKNTGKAKFYFQVHADEALGKTPEEEEAWDKQVVEWLEREKMAEIRAEKCYKKKSIEIKNTILEIQSHGSSLQEKNEMVLKWLEQYSSKKDDPPKPYHVLVRLLCIEYTKYLCQLGMLCLGKWNTIPWNQKRLKDGFLELTDEVEQIKDFDMKLYQTIEEFYYVAHSGGISTYASVEYTYEKRYGKYNLDAPEYIEYYIKVYGEQVADYIQNFTKLVNCLGDMLNGVDMNAVDMAEILEREVTSLEWKEEVWKFYTICLSTKDFISSF